MARKKATPGTVFTAAAVIDPPAPEPVNTIVNIIAGTVLHLGDGRKLACGESAAVGGELAALLRANGQAE